MEYAPGGELFDFILRHKYLKERDACRLFAQLISGVSYLHSKKVIHRDLKLENLLLDRGRNIIITDFGFANRFEHRLDDLMATSCGSPCYAAPELVISDGLYVGSAVDIWSCGVILYAMLAGYLPFDDDPQNPEGDNINLLYKYIVSTPLTFPDFVSPQARHLLSMMLVPDPTKRCSVQDIMAHPWLKSYSHLFDRSVDQWEQLSQDLLHAKRMAQKRQLQNFEMESVSPSIIRSQTEADPTLFPSITSKNARHQSAMGIPTSTSTYQQQFSSLSPVDYLQKANQDAANEYLEYQNRLDTSQNKKRDAPDSQSNNQSTSKRNIQRHTIQVEYENQEDENVEPLKSSDTNYLSPNEQLPKLPPLPNQIPTPPLNAAEEANTSITSTAPNVNSVPLPNSESKLNLDENTNKKVKRETAPVVSTKQSTRHQKGLSTGNVLSTDQSSDKVSDNKTSKPPVSSGAIKMMNKHQDDENKSVLSSNRSSGGNVSSNSKDSIKKSSTGSGRRKALSLMVEPFGKSSSANKDRNKALNQSNKIDDENSNKRERKSSAAFLSSNTKPSNQISTTSPPSGTFTNVAGTTFDGSHNQINSHKGSSSRAKSVMNWFRNKGLAKASVGDVLHNNTNSQPLQNDQQSVNIKMRPSTAGAQTSSQLKTVSDDIMDTHTGTVDQNALTALPPSVAMAEVKRVITRDLGLIIKKEGQVGLKCVRPSKKQQQQLQSQQQPQQPNLLSSSSSGGGLRSLLMFKRSSSQSTNLSAGLTSTDDEVANNTVYGESQVDSAGEVVLDVKLTKIKNLPG